MTTKLKLLREKKMVLSVAGVSGNDNYNGVAVCGIKLQTLKAKIICKIAFYKLCISSGYLVYFNFLYSQYSQVFSYAL